jgi:long-chain acyl-CoA synthetase
VDTGDTIASTLWAAARRYPQRPAVIQHGRCWTFEDLSAHTRRLIGPLSDLGVRRGEAVALFLENSPAFIAAHYALATIGAVVVPLNHYFRGKALEEVLEMSEARVIVASPPHLETLRSIQRPQALRACLILDGADLSQPLRVSVAGPDLAHPVSEAPPLIDFPEPSLSSGATVDDLAVLFFTSGTTGTPKGIRLTNRQALVAIDAWVRRWEYGPDTVSLMVAPFFHVVYHPLVIGAHRQGGAAAIVSNLQARAATREVEQCHATGIMGTPFFYIQLLNDRTSLERDLSSIRAVIFGAAPTPPSLIRALERRFPAARLYNCYGLTETGSAVSCLSSDDLLGHETSVGKAHPGVEVSIRGEDYRELPVGETGEVWCRGPNVITSYFKAPEANAARLHEGWLRTGDMGCVDQDSFLYLFGRCDDLINVAGEKVYPSAIENVLHEHPAVLDAAVSVAPEETKGQVIKAFVVLRAQGEAEAGELKRFCLLRLPPVFVPKIFEFVDALPRNPSGKVLRRQLPGVGSRTP